MKNSFQFYEKEILNILMDTKAPVIIQLGHFSLVANRIGNLIPAIITDIKDKKLHTFVNNSNYMGDFPIKTFNSGLNIAKRIRDNKVVVKFSMIVNDWQWVNKGLYKKKQSRKDFYIQRKFPLYYKKLLLNNNFTFNDFILSNDYVQNNIYNSELKLRKNGKKDKSLCSPTTCATEYYPYLQRILQNNNILISYIPLSCKIPVLFSCKKFILDYDDKLIIHIFYDPLFKNIELSVLTKKIINSEIGKKIDIDFMKSELMSK